MVTASHFATQQRVDPELSGLIDYLEGQSDTVPQIFKRSVPAFCLRDGVLVKKNFDPTKKAYLLVVPSSLRQDILLASHDEAPSGHLGCTRTLARILECYYWPRIAEEVKHYVRMCKTPPTKPAGLLQPIKPSRRLFQQVRMDILGPFHTSTAGNKWIIVATDYLTRYAETCALSRATAGEAAKFFICQIVLRHGAPDVIITDRGTAFCSELMQVILRYSRTTHRRTTAYHPQTNGLTERLNKTLADMMSMYVNVEHKTWDEKRWGTLCTASFFIN